MSTNKNIQSIKISQLRNGDIVLTHGMRVLVDGEIHNRPTSDPSLPVFWTVGTVLNIDDSDLDPMVRSFVLGDNVRMKRDKHVWQIQSNDLATWYIER